MNKAKLIMRMLSANARMKPSFFVIGGARCGSTFLFRHIAMHPQIVAPVRKEIYYFNTDKYIKSWGWQWYQALFPFIKKKGFITGEATPEYLFRPYVAKRMKHKFPQAKIIAILRNPVDRAYAHYQQQKNSGYIKRDNLSFEAVIEQELSHLDEIKQAWKKGDLDDSRGSKTFAYLTRGMYVQQLNPWFREFNSEQVMILKSEDMFADPANIMRQVFNFLKVKEWKLEKFQKKSKPRNYPPMRAETRARLHKFFKPYNRDLYKMIGEDFNW